VKRINLKLPKIRLPSNKVYDWISEASMFAGFLMVGYGLWLIYKPLMFIVCGIALFLFGFPGRRAK